MKSLDANTVLFGALGVVFTAAISAIGNLYLELGEHDREISEMRIRVANAENDDAVRSLQISLARLEERVAASRCTR